MRRNLLLAVIAALVVYTGSLPAKAAQADTAGPAVTLRAVDTTKYPTVSVTLTGPPQLAGQAIPAEAFGVSEAGAAKQASVERIADQPLEVMLAIDTSGSMAGKPLDAAKAAADSFARRMPPQTRIGVVGFGRTPTLVRPLTTDTPATVNAIDSLGAGGETALYDALALAAAQFGSNDQARRSVVLLSDGADTVSKVKADDIARSLASLHVRLYAAALTTPATDRAVLDQLTAPTGGRVVAASDPAALEGVYGTIAGELVDGYRITYKSAAHGHSAVHIAITWKGVTGAVDAAVDLPVAPIPPSRASRSARSPAGAELAVGGAAAFGAMLLVGLLLFAPRRPRIRIIEAEEPHAKREHSEALQALARRATEAAARSLKRRDAGRSLNTRLEQAGISLRAEEFVVLVVVGAVVGMGLGLVLGGLVAGVLLAVAATGVAYLALSLVASRRKSRFGAQLSDVLQLLAGSLRSGYGFLQAADAVAQQADAPASEEFHRLMVEIRLGRNPTEALHAMATRMGSRDFEWAAQAIEIHREVGGDLAEVLDTTAATIRERDTVRRQVKALSAEGRLSAIILFALPFVIAVLVSVTNRGYMSILFTSGAGNVMVALGVVLMVVGFFWLRKIVRLVY